MRKSIVLDTNLIVLLVVGLTDVSYLGKHKAISSFLPGDFDVLQSALVRSKGIVVTPHVLAEASNLLRQIADPIKTNIGKRYQTLIREFREIYISSETASSRREFFRHGLADMSSLEAITEESILLSADGPLCYEARMAGKEAINFAQLREDYLGMERET